MTIKGDIVVSSLAVDVMNPYERLTKRGCHQHQKQNKCNTPLFLCMLLAVRVFVALILISGCVRFVRLS